MKPQQRSVVVTGVGKGIGRAIARHLTDEGWIVVGVDVTSTAEPVEEGACAEVVGGDVAGPAVHTAAAAAARRLAPLAGWVNNAGITQLTPLHRLDPDSARRVVEVNGLGSLWGCSAAVTAFIDQAGPGSIVNIGSIHGQASGVDHAAYEFTKGGVEALARSVAVTYGRLGIRANTVAPGGVLTPHLEAQIARASDPAAERRRLSDGPPLGRIALPDEIAELVAFLLSERSAYISGQTIGIDGAWSAAFGTPRRNTELEERYRRAGGGRTAP